MNSVPQHLLNEDRQEYERILSDALRSAPHRPELAALGQRLNPEQLRTMALDATAFITTAAATEYQHYVKVRKELRQPAPSTPSTPLAPLAREGSASGSAEPGGATVGLATTMGEVTETAGAGAVAIVAVLAPVLAGTAAAIFLLVGWALKMLTTEPAIAQTLVTTGWVFGAITAVAILVASVGLLLTALRNGAVTADDVARSELSEEVDQARDAWREALLERGILPFLHEALTDPGSAAPGSATPGGTITPQPTNRIPNLGYNRPGFSSPDGGSTTGTRPSFSSPDYTSPDYGGPEHQPD